MQKFAKVNTLVFNRKYNLYYKYIYIVRYNCELTILTLYLYLEYLYTETGLSVLLFITSLYSSTVERNTVNIFIDVQFILEANIYL
jgi:hypothetical protein